MLILGGMILHKIRGEMILISIIGARKRPTIGGTIPDLFLAVTSRMIDRATQAHISRHRLEMVRAINFTAAIAAEQKTVLDFLGTTHMEEGPMLAAVTMDTAEPAARTAFPLEVPRLDLVHGQKMTREKWISVNLS